MKSVGNIIASSPSSFPLQEKITGIISSAIIHVAVIFLLLLISVYKMTPQQQIIQVNLIQLEATPIGAPKAVKPITAVKVNSTQDKISRMNILQPSVPLEDVSAVNEQPVGIAAALPVESPVAAASGNLEISGLTSEKTQNDTKIRTSTIVKTDGRNDAATQFGYVGAPAFIHREMPVYPLLARRLGKEGKVILKLLIDMNGKLQNVEVVEPAGFGFTEAAVTAVKNSTYSPANRNGEKVTSNALLPVRFRLQ
jgi:TonB family protein